MKTYLAQKSFTETRIFGHPFTLERLIGRFLAHAAGRHTDQPAHRRRPPGALRRRVRGRRSGRRPAARRLRRSGPRAGDGWRWSRRRPAPASPARSPQPATVLIGDFGGGTSDFSVMRFDPRARQHAARPRRHRHRRRRVRLPHHRPRDRAAARQGRHLPGHGQAAAGAARILLRLRALAPAVADAHAAHAARHRRGGAHRAAPGAAAPSDRADRGRAGLSRCTRRYPAPRRNCRMRRPPCCASATRTSSWNAR